MRWAIFEPDTVRKRDVTAGKTRIATWRMRFTKILTERRRAFLDEHARRSGAKLDGFAIQIGANRGSQAGLEVISNVGGS